MAADPTGRPAAKNACIYWGENNSCTATDYFDEDDITCYSAGLCDGFGTCRGCSKYDQGGLKLSSLDADGGETAIPMNLRMYNIRAKIKKCCNWEGDSVEFKRDYISGDASIPVLSISNATTNGAISIRVAQIGFPNEFPETFGRAILKREGQDFRGDNYTTFNLSYSSRTDDTLEGVTVSDFAQVLEINSNYTLFVSEVGSTPVFKPQSHDADSAIKEKTTSCTLAVAAPWQERFTDENPYALGCNGAKAECPYYTGPTFTEVVDEKMDLGDTVTAKQIMELRFYSRDWQSMPNPIEEWENSFSVPYIWAWAKEIVDEDSPQSSSDKWAGRLDVTTGQPLIQKVEVRDLRQEVPDFKVGQPVFPGLGTAVVGGPPTYPTLIEELEDLSSQSKILFPKGTALSEPFVKKVFTHEDRFFYVSALVPLDREVFAVNLTKNPQGNLPDEFFISQLKTAAPDDVYLPFYSQLPGSSFHVELTTDGATRSINHIRLFIDSGEGELDSSSDPISGTLISSEDNTVPSLPTGNKSYIKLDVYVEFIFYHSHIAQTSFTDSFGHSMVDPWINHLTKFEAEADVLNLTGNCRFNSVFWNTIASDGRAALYSIEEQVLTSSDDPSEIEWETMGCNHIVVTFLNKKVNRTAPWAAWGEDSKGLALYVRVDRSSNEVVTEAGLPTLIEMDAIFVSVNGSILPANMAIFKVDSEDVDIGSSFDVDQDKLLVRYAYTEYKQGPISSEDEAKVKRPSDLNDKIIEYMPYELKVENNKFTVEGTHLRIYDNGGGLVEKIYTCADVIGQCYSEASLENEEKARIAFHKGGIGEEDIKLISEMTKDCEDDFKAKHLIESGSPNLFEDGVAVTYPEASKRIDKLILQEGSLHYLFVFEDEEGRPIGVKNVAMIAQSSLAQARDVEIKYEWNAHIKHYPNHNPQFLLAVFYEPLYTSTGQLVSLVEPYEPVCGDHSESNIGRNGYTAYSLETDGAGALWYPYNKCYTPRYHVNREEGHLSPAEYNTTVEGFDSNRRRNYWERARAFDKFTPFIISFINRIGCYWSERTSTAEASAPFEFLGYTKIRSNHPFGQWATERESLRVSRHWEKRNLTIEEETTTEDDGEYSLSLSDAFEAIMFDDEGNLNSGAEMETPVWVHINDGYSIVNPTSEGMSHPFGQYLLARTGDHQFGESFLSGEDARYELNEIFEERDYTITFDRDSDGTKVHSPDGTSLNVTGGLTLKEDAGREVRYVFAENSADGQTPSWAWVAVPDDIIRNNRLVNGVSIKNPERTFFSEDRTPANFALEDSHELSYTPHTFDPDGLLLTPGYITLDDGPPLYVIFGGSNLHDLSYVLEKYIVQENGGSSEEIEAIPFGDPSPYDPEAHEGSDYTFVLSGSSSVGQDYQVLADSRGVRKYKIGETTYGTFSGVLVTTQIDINELPHKVLTVGPNSGFGMGQSTIKDALKTYETSGAFSVGKIELNGHYYVESIEVSSIYGDEFEVPSVSADGILYGEISNTRLFSPSSRVPAAAGSRGTRYNVTFPIGARLTSLTVNFGARAQGKKFSLDSIIINYREHVSASESIFTYSPKVNVSVGNTGSHRPSDLEFYFQRTYPDFAKSYAGGIISLLETDFDYFATPLPSTTVKFNSRTVKDILPHFEFTDPLGGRFAYDNIDVTKIKDYTEDAEAFGGTQRFLDSAVRAGSKGWTMYTTEHEDDPGASLAHENSFSGNIPLQDLQGDLYKDASKLLGDALTVYDNFWHPKEVEIFGLYGVDLNNYSWRLVLRSTVAPMSRIYKHDQYGCYSQSTSEDHDGELHTVENWQARGAFHYQCEPKYNDACIAIVMNKCNYFFWEDYGTALYLDNDVIQRFSHTFTIPIDDWDGYKSAGLIDTNYVGGVLGGIVPTSAAATAAGVSSYRNPRSFRIDPTKPSDFQ
jgi:hypothetical protein